jgi:hypothetical protein
MSSLKNIADQIIVHVKQECIKCESALHGHPKTLWTDFQEIIQDSGTIIDDEVFDTVRGFVEDIVDILPIEVKYGFWVETDDGVSLCYDVALALKNNEFNRQQFKAADSYEKGRLTDYLYGLVTRFADKDRVV